ncbi:MAG: GMC family oxidoreductase [Bryobacteraceae bacterium]
MADTYDVIICGAGSAGGFISGQIASNGSVLILDAGTWYNEPPNPGVGTPARRALSTQVNLGMWLPGDLTSNAGKLFFTYPMYMDQSNPFAATAQREPKVVGGGSFINAGAWLRPRLIDFDGFAQATGVKTWTKAAFEPHFQRAERTLNVHREDRRFWNKASVAYEQTALSMGIPVFETASNRKNCIYCGHRLNAGMPCKYDSLMSTAHTQIPKAVAAGAKVVDQATVTQVNITNGMATGVTYVRNGQTFVANANKLVIVSAGAIGSPLLLRDSGVHLLNPKVGKHLRAHPGLPIDVLLPGTDWKMDRGYQWNIFHHAMDENGDPTDAVVHASAGFASTTPWVAAAYRIGSFGRPYKDLMRKFPSRSGAFIFEMKPNVEGEVLGTRASGVINYPVGAPSGLLEDKTLNDFVLAVRQISAIYKKMGAYSSFPNPNDPDPVLKQQMSLFVTTSGALHPQGTCRAGTKQSNSVVDENMMSWDVKNLMVCDASVIPNHISSNPNAMIMAVGSRASDFINRQILGANSASLADDEHAEVAAQ